MPLRGDGKMSWQQIVSDVQPTKKQITIIEKSRNYHKKKQSMSNIRLKLHETPKKDFHMIYSHMKTKSPITHLSELTLQFIKKPCHNSFSKRITSLSLSIIQTQSNNSNLLPPKQFTLACLQSFRQFWYKEE